MTLYYVHPNGPDGENVDMFVNADSHSEAGQILVDFWAGEGVELYRGEPIMAVVVPPAGPKGIVTWGSLDNEECTVTHPDLSHLWES